ncbi:hypothetical protein RO3G_06066 [Rhizopus delemar RA 99-880]|uniref:Uncharacterized protein n=1 Tax=Rhizopus delemar (strain RA 99-880 / ATCC MYA-4621 / FGSC 9543 / NRRL 43880) TaxID=246409 RepID=I1BYT1_RHIO9|nr:hypothetical protein RO3G_06066 [Rhizopus delemar RA 99-880]|eukprot:EIE81361.1 hypothetical protein RO3G_06066 [Rhizopus delemar RA 99-880]
MCKRRLVPLFIDNSIGFMLEISSVLLKKCMCSDNTLLIGMAPSPIGAHFMKLEIQTSKRSWLGDKLKGMTVDLFAKVDKQQFICSYYPIAHDSSNGFVKSITQKFE